MIMCNSQHITMWRMAWFPNTGDGMALVIQLIIKLKTTRQRCVAKEDNFQLNFIRKSI